MLKLTDKEAPGKRLVLSFDGGCLTCSELAKRIEGQVGDKLEVMSLRDPRVQEWRERTLGEDAPWVPTLFEVEGSKVRAWTGWWLGVNLSRFLGPVATWRVMQALGEVDVAPKVDGSPVTGMVVGLTRGQFLKGVGSVVVAMYFLSSTATLAPTALAEDEDCNDDEYDDPMASTGTPERQEKAKAIVRNSVPYKTLQRQQKRRGGGFEWSKAVVKAGCGNVATVQVASNTKKRNLFAAFFVNLRTGKLMFHNGQAFTLYGDKEIKVRRLVNKPGVPHPWVIVGEEHVTTASGEKMTHEQFEEEIERIRDEQQGTSQQGVSRQRAVAADTTTCDQCLLDAHEANADSQFIWQAGCGTVEGALLVGGIFAGPAAPAVGTVAAGVFAGCLITSLFGFPDPETVCADVC